jgi:hypothetical protein
MSAVLTRDEQVEMLRLADDICAGEISEFDQVKCDILVRALRLAAEPAPLSDTYRPRP